MAPGGLPPIQAFAELLEYVSVSYAHDVTNALTAQQLLVEDEREGWLLPGLGFGMKRFGEPNMSPPRLEAFPRGIELALPRVSRVASLVADCVLAGDCPVLVPANRTGHSGMLMLTRSQQHVLEGEPRSEWKVAGVLVTQFRSYKS